MSEDRACRADDNANKPVPAPQLPYRPPVPGNDIPGIGLIGCGGIAPYHLRAYRAAGWPVKALYDRNRERAEALRNEFFPEASVTADAASLFARADIGVVDLAIHPAGRVALVEAALDAGKHVLSQKPFATDLDTARRLIALADKRGRLLAVNHNGRWAPHFCWMRRAVAAGLLGEVTAMHCAVHWNHNWTAGTAFDKVHHLVLADFGIHWFDMVSQVFPGREARSVFASCATSPAQQAAPPLLAQAAIQYDHAQATLVFDGDTRFGALDETSLIGTHATLRSTGPDLTHQTLTLATESGLATPELEGDWFSAGFEGTMAELLCAIQENRQPENAASTTLPGLALCFAAMKSADTGRAVTIGDETFRTSTSS